MLNNTEICSICNGKGQLIQAQYSAIYPRCTYICIQNCSCTNKDNLDSYIALTKVELNEQIIKDILDNTLVSKEPLYPELAHGVIKSPGFDPSNKWTYWISNKNIHNKEKILQKVDILNKEVK